MSTATSSLSLKKKYRIGKNLPGSPNLALEMAVNTSSQTISGVGKITWEVSPPLDRTTYIQGNYENVGAEHLAQAVGYAIPPQEPISPDPVNFRLKMSLADDWRTGTAEFSFLDGSKQWVHSGTVPVAADKTDE